MNRVVIEKSILSENNRIAAELREALTASGALALNFISSPGSGKTMLLEKTLELLPAHTRLAVLTGDIQTDNDARRLLRYGHPVRQICTGGACHLDAAMVAKHLEGWLLKVVQLLLIENVGNLVCPTSYDLGEDAKIVILSVTEGDDKPLKYPGIFRKAELMILNKIDLLPHVPFQLELARENARRIHPEIEIIETSCTTGAGLGQWMRWLEARAAKKVAAASAVATRNHSQPGGWNAQLEVQCQRRTRQSRLHAASVD
jgi:hydrogenase nickel incorporation protein HypB